MRATDFIYDGVQLSSLGYIVCTFDSGGTDSSSAGSEITFNSVKQHGGVYYAQTGTEYEQCFSTTFSICKNTTDGPGQEIPLDEYRKLMRWLNRRRFYDFVLLDPKENGWKDITFQGSFNVEKIEFAGNIIGLNLTFNTNRPFGVGKTTTVAFSIEAANGTYNITNDSDEIGVLYPDLLEVTCKQDGDLSITNNLEGRVTFITGCTAGEKITMDCVDKIVTSSLASHKKIYNDFNFTFFRLYNSYSDRVNTITFSIPCDVKIIYRPIRKVVF